MCEDLVTKTVNDREDVGYFRTFLEGSLLWTMEAARLNGPFDCSGVMNYSIACHAINE